MGFCWLSRGLACADGVLKRFRKWQWYEKGGKAQENRCLIFMALLGSVMFKEAEVTHFFIMIGNFTSYLHNVSAEINH